MNKEANMSEIDYNTKDKENHLKHFMLYYKLVPDILNARIPYKDKHMNLLHEFSSRGLVFVGGEVTEGFPAVFMFEGESDEIVREWLKIDPYIINNLVVEYRFNQIILVSGKMVNQMTL
jgi:hypothetical protein